MQEGPRDAVRGDLHGDFGIGGASRVHALVPLTIVLIPLLIEFAWLLDATATLKRQAARAGAAAAVGAAPCAVEASLAEDDGPVDGDRVECTLLWRRREADGGWSAWRRLGIAESGNNAAPGDRIRVVLKYRHPLALGLLLAPVFGADERGTVPLEAVAVVVRE